MRYIPFFIMLLVLAAGCTTQQPSTNAVTNTQPDISTASVQEEAASARSEIVGMKAPDFTLPDKDSNLVTLTDFQGKYVILYFYPQDDTPGCTTEANDFTRLEGRFQELKARIIGVSPDSVESHKRFSDKQGIGFDLLSDTDHKVMRSYGAWVDASFGQEQYGRVIRTTFIIDPSGVIRYHWPEVIPTGHANRVLEKLTQLQS